MKGLKLLYLFSDTINNCVWPWMARVEKSEPIFSACFLVSWKNRLKQIIVCSPFEEITWYLSWRSWRISFTPKVLCFSFSVVSTQQCSNPHEIQRQWRQKLSNNLAIKETKRFCNNTIDWSYSTSLSKIVTPILHSVVICCTSQLSVVTTTSVTTTLWTVFLQLILNLRSRRSPTERKCWRI